MTHPPSGPDTPSPPPGPKAGRGFGEFVADVVIWTAATIFKLLPRRAAQ